MQLRQQIVLIIYPTMTYIKKNATEFVALQVTRFSHHNPSFTNSLRRQSHMPSGKKEGR
jgi:hypothetical protein